MIALGQWAECGSRVQSGSHFAMKAKAQLDRDDALVFFQTTKQRNLSFSERRLVKLLLTHADSNHL
jgi:hypothetical protein